MSNIRLLHFCIFILFIGNSLSSQIMPSWERLGMPPAPDFTDFSEHDGRLWAANGSLYWSDDDGESWQLHEDLLFEDIIGVEANSGGVIASRYWTYGISTYIEIRNFEVFHSANNGVSFSSEVAISSDGHTHWGNRKSTDLMQKRDGTIASIEYGTGTSNGITINLTMDGGVSWEDVWTDNSYFDYDFNYTIDGDSLLLYIAEEDSLAHFVLFNDDFSNPEIHSFLADETVGIDRVLLKEGTVFLLTESDSLLVSDNWGASFTAYDLSIIFEEEVNDIEIGKEGIVVIFDTRIYALDEQNLMDYELIFSSSVPDFYYNGNLNPLSYFLLESKEIVQDRNGVFIKKTGETDFSLRSNGLGRYVKNLQAIGNIVWALTAAHDNYSTEGLWYRSNNLGQTWQLESNHIFCTGCEIKALGEIQGINLIFSQGNVYASNDNGISWALISDLPESSFYGFTKNQNKAILYSEEKAYLTEDGFNYTQLTYPDPGTQILFHADSLFNFSEEGRRTSLDYGLSWSEATAMEGPVFSGEKICSFGDFLGRYREETNGFNDISQNNGLNWLPNYPPLGPFGGSPTWTFSPEFFCSDSEIVFAKSSKRVKITRNAGLNWINLEGPYRGHFYHVYDAGPVASFEDFYYAPTSVVVSGDKVFAYTSDQGIFRADLSDITDILPSSSDPFGTITGRLFRDTDNDCLHDQGEFFLENKVIAFDNFNTITNSEGVFTIELPPSDDPYELQVPNIDNHLLDCPLPGGGEVLVESLSIDTIDLPYSIFPGIKDLNVEMWHEAPFRSTTSTTVYLKVSNEGSEILENVEIEVSFDPNLHSVLNSTGGSEIETGIWNFSLSLALDEIQYFSLTLETYQGNNGDLTTFVASCPIIDDANQENNTSSFTSQIVAAFDPNDKTVWQNEPLLPFTANELRYRIRFQNTGTDTAFRVIVLDTLPAGLDLSSLEIIDASHDYELNILQPEILQFVFDDIYLPDSTANEPDSHGHILFGIRTLDDLTDGEQLLNNAAIYFDYNDPIITNQTLTTIEKGELLFTDTLIICSGDTLNGEIVTNNIITVDTVIGVLYDSLFVNNIVVLPTYEININYEFANDTIIHGTQVSSDTSFTILNQTQSGCDSLVHYTITFDEVSSLTTEDQSFNVILSPTIGSGNPRLTFYGDINLSHNIRVSNEMGKVLFVEEIFSNSIELPLSKCPLGIYYVYVEGWNQVIKYVKIE